MTSKKLDDKIKLTARTVNVQIGQEVKVILKLYDENKKVLKQKEYKEKVQENTKVEKRFTISNLADELNIDSSKVKYISGWIDADDDGEITREYEKEVWIEVIEEKTYLYFILYSKDSEHIKKLEKSVEKAFNDIKKEIHSKQNPKNHIVYLKAVNSANSMIKFVQNKIIENGGKDNIIIGKMKAIREIKQDTSLFDKIKEFINFEKKKNNLLKPQIYFKDEINQQLINEYNKNIMRNEKIHKQLRSSEHKKYVMIKVANDLDNISDISGIAGSAFLTMARFYPISSPITIPIGGGLEVLSFATTAGKNLFKYFADEFKKEELVTDLILAKTIYCKENELAEFAYDKTFSEMAKYFYE